MMDEAEIRAFLHSFVSSSAQEVEPARMDKSEILVKLLSSDPNFLQIRNDIANTKVAIARAQRPGSASKATVDSLDVRLRELNADRQRVITRMSVGDGFVAARQAEKEAFENRKAAWNQTRELVTRATAILGRPRLPSLLKPRDLDIVELLSQIELHVDATPKAGNLMLMGAEPRPSSPAFDPINSGDLGLNPKVFAGSIRLCASPNSERGDEAVFKGGVISRDTVVMVLGADRRPEDLATWRALDPFLPLATRMVMVPIIPMCLPHSSPYSVLNKLLSVESWRSIRDKANNDSNSTCVVCGQNSAGVVKADWTFLEPLRSGHSFGIQRLDGVRSYCSQCSGVVFPMPSDLVSLAPSYAAYQPDKEVYVINAKMRRLSRLNRWDEDASPDPLAEAVALARSAHQRRSRSRWALDLSVLHGSNLVLHPDMVTHRKGWIMRREDLTSFDDHRSVHFTRIFNASFATEAGRLHFYELPPVFTSAWNTSLDDLRGEVVETPSSGLPFASEYGSSIDTDPAGPENPDEEDVMIEEGPPL